MNTDFLSDASKKGYNDQLKYERGLQRTIVPLPFEVIGGQVQYGSHPISDFARERLASMLSIPANFPKKCSPTLEASIFREFRDKTDKDVHALIAEDGSVSSFLWEDARSLKSTSIVEAMALAMPEMQLAIFRPGDKYTLFVAEKNAFSVIKGDEIHFGISISGSLSNARSLKVKFSFFRPTCTNGARVDQQSWTMPSRMDSELSMLTTIVDRARELMLMKPLYETLSTRAASTELKEPLVILSRLIDRFGMGSVGDYIMEAYRQEPMSTVWGIINAMTRAANGLGEDRADSLWKSSAHLLEEGDSCVFCTTCPSRSLVSAN